MQTATVHALPLADQENRKGRITSTRAVRLVRGEALAVFNEMMGIADPLPDIRLFKIARRLERPMIELAAEERGWNPVVYQPGTIICRTNPRLATSADAIVYNDDRAIEAKNRMPHRAKEYEGDQPMEDEIVQAQHHMGVLGLSRASIVVLIGGTDLRIFDLEHDAEMWEGLQEVYSRFLRDHVDTGRPPPIDGSDAAAEYLRKTFPRDTAPVLDADEKLDHLVRAYRATCEAFDAAEEAKSAAGNLLREAIGNAAGIRGPNFSVSYKASKDRMTTDWEQVVRELAVQVPAELLARCTVTKPGPRSLRVNWKGE